VNILEKKNVMALFTMLEDAIFSKEARKWFSMEKVQLQLTMLNVAILNIVVQTHHNPIVLL
jgi:hypothetical protein